jgi:hypothetical protein
VVSLQWIALAASSLLLHSDTKLLVRKRYLAIGEEMPEKVDKKKAWKLWKWKGEGAYRKTKSENQK